MLARTSYFGIRMSISGMLKNIKVFGIQQLSCCCLRNPLSKENSVKPASLDDDRSFLWVVMI